jgi:hypothetical protein
MDVGVRFRVRKIRDPLHLLYGWWGLWEWDGTNWIFISFSRTAEVAWTRLLEMMQNK